MQERVRRIGEGFVRSSGKYVLYWLRVNRRAGYNHALAFAAQLANRLELPLLVYERLGCHAAANDRHHTFVLEGVPELEADLKSMGAGYLFHLERRAGEGRRVLPRLTGEAAALVTDDYPGHVAARYGYELPGPLGLDTYAVDSSCIVPMWTNPRKAYAAFSLRPRIKAGLPRFLKPVKTVAVKARTSSWKLDEHTLVKETEIPELIAACAIDHTVCPSSLYRGGRGPALSRLDQFLTQRLRRYSADHHEPAAHATSGLSPYLHAGHISPLEVALAVQQYAAAHKLMADEFLEELIVRRELAFNFALHTEHLDTLEAVPEWARNTLEEHRTDPRPSLYSFDEFDGAATHDDLWNATQTELRERGSIHGYYRMYWGKKILEWSPSAASALDTMLRLHDRYALDGQNPNTFANIFWCLGLHDRPWPERAVYGKIRSMTRQGMDRKTGSAAYIREIDYLQRTGKEIGA